MVRLTSAVLVLLALAASASAQVPLSIQYGGGPAKMSGEVAARKAVAAMVAEKFPFAEVTADGHARGWSDRAAVFVLCHTSPDAERSQVLVVAACADASESGRLRDAVRAHVFEGKDDPKTPKRVAPADGKGPPAPATFFVKSEERTATPLLKHFAPVGCLAMEKLGMQTKPDGQILVQGSGPSAMGMVLLGPTANALNAKLSVVTITSGEKPSEKLAADILDRVVKVLYE